jgi:hypothetical protein
MHWTAWALNFSQPTSGTIIIVAMDYGHPERAFFPKNLEFWGLGKHFLRNLGVFSAVKKDSINGTAKVFFGPSYFDPALSSNIYLRSGFEFGPQRI